MQDKQVISTEPDIASPRRSDRQEDISEWNREAGGTLAVAEGLKLTDDHWEVIDFLRAYYLEKGKPANARVVADALSTHFADRGGRGFLYRLFPDGPVTQGSRIAAIPIPAYSEDISFGTAF